MKFINKIHKAVLDITVAKVKNYPIEGIKLRRFLIRQFVMNDMSNLRFTPLIQQSIFCLLFIFK